jgi:hypothetical protein
MVASMDMPPHARAVSIGRGHRFAAYPQCSADMTEGGAVEADRELRDLVDQLDRLIPTEGAKLMIPSDPDGNTTLGTERGYLRLGIEILRATLARQPADDRGVSRIPLDISSLLTQESDTPFDLCEVDDQVERWHPRFNTAGRVAQAAGILAVLVVLTLILIGGTTVLRWVFG